MANSTLRADALTSSVGVNTHLDFANYGYQNLSQTEAAINYLGVDLLRDSPGSAADVGANGLWQQVANATGAKFDAFIGETSQSDMSTQLSRMETLAGQGILSAMEGGNEEDDAYPQSQGNTLAYTASFQAQVYAAAHAAGLPAINMSFGAGWTAANNWHGNYDKVGNLASVADYANAHTYPAAGSGQPATAIGQLNSDANLAASGQPVITTEIGWDNASTDPTTAAKYSLDAIMDGIAQGDAGMYFYALYDDGSGQFGLFNADGTPKPAATAIHNLMTAMADGGANAATFAPTQLAYSLSGTQTGDNSLAFQKSDGSYDVALWNEQSGSHTVTLAVSGLTGNVQVYDPLTGATTTEAANGGSVSVALTDHPVLVEIPAQGASAGSAQGAPTGTGGSGTPPVTVTAPPPSSAGSNAGSTTSASPGTTGNASAPLLGAYVGNPGDSGFNAQYASFTSAMGQAPGALDTYIDSTLPESQWASNAQWAAGVWSADPSLKSTVPVIGLPMAAPGQSADAAFQAIASGQYDSDITGIFQAWASAGYTNLYLRPGFEMTGAWMNWATTPSNAADFVAAFQHIASLAHSFQGANISVVWNPNVGSTSVPLASLYPGDASVDVVGLDTYGAPVDGGDPPGNTSTDPGTITLKDALAFAKTHGKPFALPETGGLDATFAQQLGATVAASGVPVAFVNLWDINDSSGNLSWSTGGQSAVASAWKSAFNQITSATPATSGDTGSASGTGTGNTTPPPTGGSGSGSFSSTPPTTGNGGGTQPVTITAPPPSSAGSNAGSTSNGGSTSSTPPATTDGTPPSDPQSSVGTPGMEVAQVYRAALDRLPDDTGYAFWKGALSNGALSLSQEAAGFLGSQEYAASHSSQSNGSFVSGLYHTALGRAPEASGFAAWTGALNSGATRAQVLAGIAGSPEALMHNGPGIIAAGYGH